MSLHVHVSIESADCDGRYSRSYVITPGTDDKDEWDFRASIIGNALSYASAETTAQFTDDGFTVDAPTDEGYSHSEFTWCDDDDANRVNTFRDHSAEAAGY